MGYTSDWLRAFLTTTVIEAAVVVVVMRSRVRWDRAVVAAIFAQLITHPAVWFILPALQLPRLWFLGLAESWAVLIETFFYGFVFTRFPWWRLLSLSIVANGASWGAGTLLRQLGAL